MAKCVWALEREEIMEHICQFDEQDARAWLSAVLSSLSQQEITRVVVTLWAIWHARRKAIHESIFQSPLSTHSFVERFISDLGTLTPQPEKKAGGTHQGPRWIPPPVNMTKVNVDAAISKNSGRASAAAVARNAEGLFLGASAVVMTGLTDPETMEGLACREGLALAQDLLLRRVRLASDCANAVGSIKGEARGQHGQVIREI